MTKYQSVIQHAHELRTKSEKLGGELNPEEEQRFRQLSKQKGQRTSSPQIVAKSKTASLVIVLISTDSKFRTRRSSNSACFVSRIGSP